MSCQFPRETLALHVEGDLSEVQAARAETHLLVCPDCAAFFAALGARQALVKSLRRQTVAAAEGASLRRAVMTAVNDRPHALAWWRVERAVVIGLERTPVRLAACALLALLSVSVWAEVRDRQPEGASAAVFDGGALLRRPEGYRNWVRLDPPPGHDRSAARAYVNPAAYRDRTRTGRFPEGTVLVWEAAPGTATPGGAHAGPPSLLVSVKNGARFNGGWGFFDFTAAGGAVTATAEPLPESAGCRMCHRPDGTTDLTPKSPSPL